MMKEEEEIPMMLRRGVKMPARIRIKQGAERRDFDLNPNRFITLFTLHKTYEPGKS